MVRTCQQESGTSALVHEPAQGPMQNNHLSTIKEKAQTEWLTHVEKNVDVVRATMERMEAALMHLTQCVNSRTPQKPETQLGPLHRREAHKPWQTNNKHRQRVEHSPQGSVSVSNKRNEVTSGRCASTL